MFNRGRKTRIHRAAKAAATATLALALAGCHTGEKVQVVNTGFEPEPVFVWRLETNIRFVEGDYKINDGHQRDLEAIAATIHRFPSPMVTVYGHVDHAEVGDGAQRLSLSLKRAKAVAEWLRTHSTAQKIVVKAMSDEMPASLCSQEANRRVEVAIRNR